MNITTGPLTPNQRHTLTGLLSALRPDWDATGIHVALRTASDRGSAIEVVRAAIEAAALASNRTPAIIGMAGPHWTTKTSGHVPATREERCPKEFHTGTAWNCPQCRAELIAVDVDHGQTKAVPVVHKASPEYVRAVREQMERGIINGIPVVRGPDGRMDTDYSQIDDQIAPWSPTAGLPDEPAEEPDGYRSRADWGDD